MAGKNHVLCATWCHPKCLHEAILGAPWIRGVPPLHLDAPLWHPSPKFDLPMWHMSAPWSLKALSATLTRPSRLAPVRRLKCEMQNWQHAGHLKMRGAPCRMRIESVSCTRFRYFCQKTCFFENKFVNGFKLFEGVVQ